MKSTLAITPDLAALPNRRATPRVVDETSISPDGLDHFLAQRLELSARFLGIDRPASTLCGF